jgi:hypothetical protein
MSQIDVEVLIVKSDRDVKEASLLGADVARELGFDKLECSQVVLAISEIAGNSIKFAEQGQVTIRHELKSTENLLKQAQIACFKDHKMSADTYKVRHERFLKRIGTIKRRIPVFEAIASGSKVRKLKEKKKGVLEIK